MGGTILEGGGMAKNGHLNSVGHPGVHRLCWPTFTRLRQAAC